VNSPLALAANCSAQLCETHSGVVILVGDLAYKIKKPVDLGFLDFRTERARRDACHREFELNRRLAPDVYLDVAELRGSDGAVREHVLVMRRMPAKRRMSTLISSGADVTAELDALAEIMADFHAAAARGEAISDAGRGPALLTRWNNNLAETTQYRGTVLDRQTHDDIARLARRYVTGRTALLDARADTGCVVDGHGDLIAEDIFCLPDGPRVLDCLEFDDSLRWVDVLDDIAFLAMDLEHLGHAELAERLLHRYGELTASVPPESLQHHYVAYRAFVRAKVSCIRAAQGDDRSAAQARALAALALNHLRAGEVRLILVGGAPGTGKTTLAHALAPRLGAEVLSSDDVRAELGQPNRYTPQAKAATYRELLARAEVLLRHGRSVVADATWSTEVCREAARALATSTASRVVELECRLPVELAAGRAQQRLERAASSSEAGGDVARRLAAERDAWPRAVPLDMTATPEEALAHAARVAGPASRDPGPTALPPTVPASRPFTDHRLAGNPGGSS
jgi:aminoglycoside phosphotransferase family enzyme/predicted kinase